MKYAKIENNKVIEILTPVEGFTVQQCFHADVLKNAKFAPAEVQAGWSYNAETGEFTAPQES